LFEPFFTTKFLGRGLGMSAVQGIVRGHEGTLFVDTAPGKGTTVSVVFPAMAVPEEEDSDDEVAESAEESRASDRGVVLVVDDDEAVRVLGEKMVARLGFRTRTARDGLEALEIFRAHDDDIAAVLLDLSMPRMDGVRAAEALREMRPELPILLSSGFSQKEAVRRLNPADISGFIQKPYRMSALREAFARLLPPA
ncbi:MAG: response regulator, partial [Desulfococcaceae bacterium]